QWLAERFGLSQRRVCRLLDVDRNTLRYRCHRQADTALRTRIREMAESKRRYGCPRIYVWLRREGWPVNHKKVDRLYYREEQIALQRRCDKKTVAVARVALRRPTRPGLCYARYVVHDPHVAGPPLKCLTMTDPCSKKAPVIDLEISTTEARV